MIEQYKPELKDLWFRKQMLEDEETMSYNRAWGGTILFPEEDWKEWYDHWITEAGDRRYYRYLQDNNRFIGEIGYHYDTEIGGYIADVIVYSCFRGKGYGGHALDLLCSTAKQNGIDVLYDEIAIDNPAIKLFLDHGFSETGRTEEKIILKKEL